MKASALCAMAIFLVGAGPSPKTHFYSAEFQKPPQGMTIGVFQVTFFADVKPDKAEAVLRRELAAAIEFSDGNSDIIANAWDASENQISMPSGKNLFYHAKTHKVDAKP